MDSLKDLERSTEWTMEYLTNLSLKFGLTRLPEHLHTLLSAFFMFLAIHQAFAPIISGWISSNFRKMNRRGQNNWSIHVVSQVHALVVVPLALQAMRSEAMNKDKAFGWDEEKSGLLQAIATAYFIWDTLDAIINYVDFGYIVHGLSCSIIYSLSFTPFLSYYASRCLLWEVSTIFLNIHWFLDKTNRTGSTLQLVNGAVLLATFFGVRLLYGAYVSYEFFCTLYDVRNEVPVLYLIVYGAGNIVLQSLNVVWFGKMIAALQKRFTPDAKSGTTKSNGIVKAKNE